MACRILLADDSITIQKVVNLTFADEGIEVVAVNNGDVAERRLAEVKPDLVLADIFMPGKNGYELCEAIKENPQFRNVPVVLLVGAFEPFDQVEARRVRADAHLTKPFESRTLVETVRRLISESPRIATGPIAPMPAADDERDEVLDARVAGAAAAPLASQLAGKLDLSAMADGGVTRSTPRARTTGELASPSPAREDPLDFGIVDAPEPEAMSETLTDTRERFEPLEFSPNGGFSPAEMAPPMNPGAQDFAMDDVLHDFDTSGPAESLAAQDPISFETEPNASREVDTSGASEGEHWFKSGSLETTRLEMPSGVGAWQPPSNGLPLSYEAPEFSLQTEAGARTSEVSTETALLEADEPLGDVLFDESVSLDRLVLPQMPASDSVGFDLAEPEVLEAALPVGTQFDIIDIGAGSSPEPSFIVEQNDAALEVLVAEAAPATGELLDSPASVPPPESETDSDNIAGGLDWTTPRAAAYSTAQLDSVVMPVDSAEYLASHAATEDVQQAENTEETGFTTAAMWTEEEARFTPIDIEGVAVDEASAEEIGPAATGFVFSSVPAEPPAASTETLVASDVEGPARQPGAAAELSSAAIEQIVRRVVAEMSESVVREVAWEVVPDCVERVIEQLTRESIAKRA